MILRVGLTGGLASGKSTVLRILGEMGCRTVDADSIVTSLYRPGHPGHAALVRAYGAEILLPDGEIDRKRVAAFAFKNSGEATRLNALIHPLVIAEQEHLMASAEAESEDAIYVIEATLLLESGGRDRYDRIVVVDVPRELQLERAVTRGMAREDALRRIENQMKRETRLASADYVIANSGDPSETRTQVARVYQQLRDDLSEKKGSGKTGAS